MSRYTRRILFVLLMSSLLAVVLLHIFTQWPAGYGGRLLVTLDEGISHALYWLDIASGELQPLPVDRAYQFVLSPDGRYVAFSVAESSDTLISIATSDTFAIQHVSSGPRDSDPRWSPDATQIVFTRSVPYRSALFLYDLESGAERQLTEFENALEADWSPDGARIIFTTSRDGFQELYTMSPDGSDWRRMTENDLQNDLQASYSPDGKTIAYMTNYSVGDGSGEIWLMDADGSNQRRLTDNTLDDGSPIWSPDNTKIAFTASYASSNPAADIFIYDVAAGALRQVAHQPGLDFSPAWSPDSQWIVYVSKREATGGLYLMRPDGTDERLLLSYDPYRIRSFLWMP